MEHDKQKEWDDYHKKNVEIILNAPIPELPKQKVDDTDLWDEVAMILFKKHNPDIDFNSEIGRRLFFGSFKKDMDELQKHYTITRK